MSTELRFSSFFDEPSPSAHESAASEGLSPSAPLSLFVLNSRVRAMLKHTMPQAYWITAEINEHRVASNGHCYMELVEKDADSGTVIAKARANIWNKSYLRLSSMFAHVAGRRLSAGIKVMVCVNVTFHELYGFSLNVIDIDPSYTIGDLAQRRQRIISQLEADGIIDLNKELTLPRMIRRVAVISSATAAGYGDFCKQIEQSGYAFQLSLFPAVMQGESVERSIIGALDRIAAEQDRWDVVVIIRGGGATTDLNGFDSYLLAANVAQFPLPVLTGIGHERDETIIDRVAHLRLKTPTAVAGFLIDSRKNEAEVLHELQQRLAVSAAARLHREQMRLENLSLQLARGAERSLALQGAQLKDLSHRFYFEAAAFVSRQQATLLSLSTQIRAAGQSLIAAEKVRLAKYPLRLRYGALQRLQATRHRQLLVEERLRLLSPEQILRRGYSITLCRGRIVRSADELRPGDELTTRLAQGTAKSIVE